MGRLESESPCAFWWTVGPPIPCFLSAVWRAIELTPQREMSFILADGTSVERQVSECLMSLVEGEGHTPVILGEPGDEGLLGVVTLEILGLVLNPFNRTLQPLRAMLMGLGQQRQF